MPKIKLGIVGVGKIARDQHLPVLGQSKDFELIAAASRNTSVDGLRTYPSMEAMLAAEPEIEAVSLCTPPGPRELDARIALDRGIHVLLEKPPAATLSAAQDLVARAKTSALHMSWHSRHAPAVAPARQWLRGKRISSIDIAWKEDIRRWHPGQDWILEPGGMGVFDPGINALSILTALVAEPFVLTSAGLTIPRNRQGPVAADIAMETPTGVVARASFDFLNAGDQVWEIAIHTDHGSLLLSNGGETLILDGARVDLQVEHHHEYAGVYRRFADCIRANTSDCDLSPLILVADAFLYGRRALSIDFEF